MPRLLTVVGTLVSFAVVLSGCMKRTERIDVRADGSVLMQLVFEADDPAELRDGDAVPSVLGGWIVVESESENDDGSRRYRLEAEALFAPDEELPAHWADPFDDERDLVLQFPTTVTIEARRDATYVHFLRRYAPRPWAFLRASRSVRDARLAELDGRAPEALTDAERRTLVAGMIEAEAIADRVFAREAFRSALPDGPQDAWFDVERAISEADRAMDVGMLAALLAAEDDAERAARLDEERQGRDLLVRDVMEAALRTHVDAGTVNAFLLAYDRGRRAHAITEGLADDGFEIRLAMPGTIVGHNATKQDPDGLLWQFDGKAFRDGAIEIMATSRLERER